MNGYQLAQWNLTQQLFSDVATATESTQDIKDQYNAGIELPTKSN